MEYDLYLHWIWNKVVKISLHENVLENNSNPTIIEWHDVVIIKQLELYMIVSFDFIGRK